METRVKISLDKITPLICYGQHVFEFHSALQKFLQEKIGVKGKFLLGKPQIPDSAIDSKGEIFYYLYNNSENTYKSLSQLRNKDKEIALDKLSAILNSLNELIKGNKNSKDSSLVKYATVLEKAIEIPSEEHIYFDGENIAFTAWGFYTGNIPGQNSFRISKFVSTYRAPKEPPLPVIEEESGEVDNIVEEKNIDTTPVSPPPPQKPTDEKNKRKFWKYLLWILFACLIIAAIILLVNKCEREPLKSKHLPETPGIIPPVDTTEIIIPPEDTLKGEIVGNRLVVIIFQKADSIISVNEFADKYKELFPEDEYFIAGYDTLSIKQIIIEFPADKRVSVKEKLKENIEGIFILDEKIYNSNNYPADPGLNNSSFAWGLNAVKVFDAWKTTIGSEDVIIAVLDNGFDTNHPELNGKIVKPYNAFTGTNKVTCNNGILIHGTHVASIATGNTNSVGICGIAPNCLLMPVQIGDINGNITTSSVVKGIIYAVENGADVINMSFGAIINPVISFLPIEYQEALIETTMTNELEAYVELFSYAEANRVCLIQAAGNDNVVIGFDAMSRTGKTIIVSAVDDKLNRASFSNFGKRSTISAPGVSIFNAVPNNRYDFLDGTSMASPIVAGAVALIKSVYPEMTNREISDLLVRTGTPLGVVNNKVIGNLLNLSFLSDSNNYDKCLDIEEEIRKLEEEIERLRRMCDQDTSLYLTIPENTLDCSFATGNWKSSENLVNSNTNTPVMLYFDFLDNCTGEVTFVESNGLEYYAPLSITIESNKMIMRMETEASSPDYDGGYSKYRFEAIPESITREAVCVAYNLFDSQNIIDFKLFKRN
jgi:serine protease